MNHESRIMNKDIERLKKIVHAFPQTTVTVLADLVADEFIFGEISRVSREAPVLILKHRDRTIVPGGGANAIYNLAALGVTVLPVGIVGDDEPGRLLLQLFKQKRVSTSGVFKIKGHTTTTKTRILAGHSHTSRQQVVRIDRDSELPSLDLPGAHLGMAYIDATSDFLRASDALLISDYGYGAATPEIFSRVRGKRMPEIPVTLDSRFRILEYNGVTAATPNEPEVEEALGVKIGQDTERLRAAGKKLLDKMNLQSVVITRGRDGMALFERRRKPVEIPIHGTDQVADVTGAGDTVIATFTAALASGAEAEDAARLANYAGGVVVMKRGTATCSCEELLSAIDS
jgi:D-glycero-beta-D-manno-heptose-7-phosphate kinase